MLSLPKSRTARFLMFAALLFAHVMLPSIAAEEEAVQKEANVDPEAAATEAADAAKASPVQNDKSAGEGAVEGGILKKLKEFPTLGMQGAGLLQLAEEVLGYNASKLELAKLVPTLVELQKNVHDHYMVTKGQGKYEPSSLLKRVVSRKSQKKVIKTMKKFAPDTDDGELMQQLDIVTQLLHELHTNPQNSMQHLIRQVSSVAGLDLKEEDMKAINTHMQWAQNLLKGILPMFPESLGKKAEEL